LYDTLVIGCFNDKDKMYEKINNNVNKMIQNGWEEEVKTLLVKDENIGRLNALKAIGYPQIIEAIIGKKTIDIELIKQKTRQYAKRQLTWIKHHYSNLICFKQNNKTEVINCVKTFLCK